jgi:hypothetical protein
MLFKKHLAARVRAGTKTQSRRTSKIRYREGSIQPIQENYKPGKAKDHIKIDRRYEQKLGDVTEEQAKAEGFANLEEFKAEWTKIYGNFDENQVVTVYEFKVLKNAIPHKKTDAPRYQPNRE